MVLAIVNLIMKKSRRSQSVTETVESSTLSLEGVDDIHSGDSFSSGVFGVSDGISDNLFEERSENSSGVIIDERGDSLDTTSSTESSDSWFGDTVNSGSSGLSGVSLATMFANTFHSFAFSDHFLCRV